MDMVIDRKLVLKEKSGETIVYPAQYYYLELNTARMLNELNIVCPEDKELVRHRIELIEKETGTVLDEMQKKAITEAADHGLFILTGGPGTGKTTTINAIIRFFEGEGAEIRLAAPTGRAAKRMTETTGYEAQTIHRLLELNGMPEEERDGHSAKFERNAQNPLEADVIIIDEMSMVDIHLMHSLLLAVVAGTRLILVGDENQLPSVGPGNVLRDIIRSRCFHVVELTKIFRQASESDIVVNAHKINKGEQVQINNKSRDFFFLKRYDADIIIRVVIALIQEKLPRYVDAKPFEIQVLTPMRKGLLGVERLNQILQRYLNPPEDGRGRLETGCSAQGTRSCRSEIIIRWNGKSGDDMGLSLRKAWEYLTETPESSGKSMNLLRQQKWNLRMDVLQCTRSNSWRNWNLHMLLQSTSLRDLSIRQSYFHCFPDHRCF